MEEQGKEATDGSRENNCGLHLMGDEGRENIVTASQLRREVERIINNMTYPKALSEEGDESLIEVCMSKVKIKEHKLEKRKKTQKRSKGSSEFSSSADDKLDSCADSARTDVGIPPIPVCEPPRQSEIRKKSAVVLDHMSRRKVYVPGKEKSDFFKCPHRRMDDVQQPLHDTQNPLSPITMEKQVDRYHYNHFILRNYEQSHQQENQNLEATPLKRFKKACSKIRKDKSAVKEDPTVDIEPNIIVNEAPCYCGSGILNENHEKIEELSSGESIDQLYKVRVDSTTCPTNFTFRAVDKAVSRHHGEVHFIVDSRQKSVDPILENIRQSQQQSTMIISPNQQSASVVLFEEKDDISQEKPKSEQVSEQELPEKALQKQYKPVRTKPERIDIYMFDHQDSRYFHTTDNPPPVSTEVAVHKMERIATQFWAEIFSVLHVIFAFFTAFILQTVKFVLLAIGRPLTTGLIQIYSDYFLKPLLTIIFNGLVQPPVIFIYNIMTSFRDLCRPLASGIGYFIKEFAQLLSAIRLCKILSKTNNGPFSAHPHADKV